MTYELDPTEPTPAGLIEAGDNDDAGGIRMEAMAYGPGNSTAVYAIGNDPVPDANLPATPDPTATLQEQSPLHLDRERHGLRL